MKDLVSNYTEYNIWANLRLTDWLKSLDESLLQTETKSSFDTIDHTLQHMLRTQLFWKAFIDEQNVVGFNWRVRKEKVSVIIDELMESSHHMHACFASYNEADLLKKLTLDMAWAKNQLCRYEYIIHVINHSTFHRGQIITMARTLGVEDGVPATDYNIFNCR